MNRSLYVLQVRLVMAILLVFILPSNIVRAQAHSGNNLINGCNAFVDDSTFLKADQRTREAAWYCMGMIEAVTDINHLNPNFCPPEKTSLGQSLRVVIKYLNENPASLNEDFSYLALKALAQAWPCDVNGWEHKCSNTYLECVESQK